MSEKTDILRTIIGAQQQKAADSALWVSVANQHATNQEVIRGGRRQEAQVDAYLKAKFAACGMDDAYQPPDDEDMAPTLINCSFNGDRAVQQITDILHEDGGDGAPLPPDEKPSGNKWLKWLLGTLLAVTLGALIVMLSWNLFGGSDRYEIVAVPWTPET